MPLAQRSATSSQIAQGGGSSGGSGECYDSEGEGEGSVTKREARSKVSRKPTSKQKGKETAKHREAGKLSKLPDIPLDVLYEIFALVHPVDLLRISWADKALHNVLTSKSSRQVWMAAFDNIPEAQRPPSCPEDLTEIAYANLLYDPRCMDCGAPHSPAYWTARVRVCAGCIKNWVTIVGGIQDKAVVALSGGELHSSSQILPTVPIKIPPLPKRMHVFTKELKQLIADLEGTDDKSAVTQRYDDALVAKSEFARALVLLEKAGKVGNAAMLTAARDRRINQILEKLADQGWRQEIQSRKEDYTGCITGVEGACVARPLTDKAWEGMEPRILDTMRRCKKKIESAVLEARCIFRMDKMRTVVREYQRTIHPQDFCPSAEDICQIPNIREVIVDGTDEEHNACAGEVTSGLPKLASQLLDERTAKISALLPYNDPPANVLSLATAWFRCGSCAVSIHGIDTLTHQCPIRHQELTGSSAVRTRALGRGWCAETSRFRFSEVASTIARKLILDCGEDPESITLAEMNSRLHRFARCENDRVIPVSWSEMLDHKCHINSSAYSRVLRPDEYPQFVHNPDVYNGAPFWGCLHYWRAYECQGVGFQSAKPAVGFAALSTVKQHIIDEHGVEVPVEGVDYFYYHKHRPPKFVRVGQELASANRPPL